MKNVLLFLFIHFTLSAEQSSDALAQQANTAYVAGEQANTLAERQHNFNLAFHNYLLLDERTREGNGQLDAALAVSAYRLGAYPWAVLYAERALRLRPHDPDLRALLDKSMHTLALSPSPPPSAWHSLFIWHWGISLPRRLQILFGLSLAFIAVLSLSIWWKKSTLVRMACWVGAAWLLFLGSVAYTRYMEPLEAVAVRASLLYRNASSEQGVVMTEPVLPGSKLRVLTVTVEGRWLKVLTPTGDVGYFPFDRVQLI